MKDKDIIVICLTHRFSNFTKGKKYLVEYWSHNSYHIINDNGIPAYPSLTGWDCGKQITYFDTVENVREEKLKILLGEK